MIPSTTLPTLHGELQTILRTVPYPVDNSAQVFNRLPAGLLERLFRVGIDVILRASSPDMIFCSQVDFVGIESRTSFDAFDTMEVVANASAVDMLAEHAASPIVFFPTDRRNQVKMKDDIPQLWVKTGPSTLLNGSATQGACTVCVGLCFFFF